MEKQESMEAISDSVQELFDTLCYFHPDGEEEPIIPFRYRKGSCPIWVIAGENASGKSLMRRILQVKLMQDSLVKKSFMSLWRAAVATIFQYRPSGQ